MPQAPARAPRRLPPRWLAALLLVPATLAASTSLLDAAREATGRRHAFRESGRRVIVLGFDGVDPDLVREYGERLPNIARLAREGTVTACRTTDPPESPVAWATFATGVNPGVHGVFDFVRRDPDAPDPYRPLNGMVDRKYPAFGPFGIPLKPPGAVNRRGGEGFWEPVARGGFRVSVLRMPLAFPASEPRGGEILAGLGVPDLRGTNGSYTLFRAGPDASEGPTIFGGRHKKIYPRERRAGALLEGPPDPRAPGSGRFLTVPLEFGFPPEGGATVRVDSGAPVRLLRDLYSPWIGVTFRVGPLVRLHGLVRFLLLDDGRDPAIYASPIQISPQAPPVPIAAPPSFGRSLPPRKTAGWPEDTFAANDRVLGDVHVFQDILDTYREDEALLFDRLDRANAALQVMVFTAQDRASHLFFRYRDPKHPAHDPKAIDAFEARTGARDPIFESYRWMDGTIGKVLGRMGPDDVLLVVSDHGFHSWRQGLNLNTWLWRNGYLTPSDPDAQTESRTLDQFFRTGAETSHVDWTRTRAYALGLGQIYLNLAGREAGGIVRPEERRALIDEISKRLMELRSPEGEPVFSKIEVGEEIWKGPRMREAPDLQCAFADGFRVSWQTALLGVPVQLFETNDYPWSGDHCSNDAADTHGVFFSNRKLKSRAEPGLEDIAATVCALFGVPPTEGCEGTALLR